MDNIITIDFKIKKNGQLILGGTGMELADAVDLIQKITPTINKK